VWFDSGALHHCLAKMRPEMTSPADLYLEGSDQHRGWFHSSLLTSVALHSRAPYRTVLTHGFTIDDKGRKMSKSLGNVIAPQKVINALGADVLRLWIAATDYANEMSLSDEILKRVSESYRRIRNTARFFLGNLNGFDPAKDLVEGSDLLALDRWALWRAGQLQEEIQQAYRDYQFHLIYQKVHNFCSVEMGGFYLDVIKDRMYTTQTKSVARRSGQTAMFLITEAMMRWVTPILSFTAEEIWRALPGKREESALLATWKPLPVGTQERPNIDWDSILEVRAAVSRELEKLRVDGAIGAPLDAEVDLYCAPTLLAPLQQLGSELRFILITSEATAYPASERPAHAVAAKESDNEIWIVARASAAAKCVRCWSKRADVGQHAVHSELCGRCINNVEGQGEVRHYA
ncbi:MAG: class I tRNA ligase family protein, partial [Candidatus Obscuribacterales bacterium]|nr:class I tRNA ligase family protein [Steroidobacteraceae bacterium]